MKIILILILLTILAAFSSQTGLDEKNNFQQSSEMKTRLRTFNVFPKILWNFRKAYEHEQEIKEKLKKKELEIKNKEYTISSKENSLDFVLKQIQEEKIKIKNLKKKLLITKKTNESILQFNKKKEILFNLIETLNDKKYETDIDSFKSSYFILN